MIKLTDLADELHKHRGTITLWCEDMKIHINKENKVCIISEKDAERIRTRAFIPYRKKDFNKGNADVNYNWRRGLPTRIGYGGCLDEY